MHWLKLPSPANALAPAFSDLAGARTWLASQPQAQPLHMLHVLLQQIRGLDAASKLDPGALRGMLDLLRKAALPPLNALEARYTRKPLPLSDADQQTFDACYKLWESLSIAYLRLALKTADDEQAGCLQRAAMHCAMPVSATIWPPVNIRPILTTCSSACSRRPRAATA